MPREIVFKINKDTLEMTAEVEGMHGVGCANFLDSFQKAVKMVATGERKKAEFQDVKQKLPVRR
jgi:hypothetical protein